MTLEEYNMHIDITRSLTYEQNNNFKWVTFKIKMYQEKERDNTAVTVK